MSSVGCGESTPSDRPAEAVPDPAIAAHAHASSAPAALADDAKAFASVAAYARSRLGCDDCLQRDPPAPSRSLADLPLSLVAGRVCRGANEAAFETLHADGLAIHPIVFVTGQ